MDANKTDIVIMQIKTTINDQQVFKRLDLKNGIVIYETHDHSLSFVVYNDNVVATCETVYSGSDAEVSWDAV
jgi:hypothetical protein